MLSSKRFRSTRRAGTSSAACAASPPINSSIRTAAFPRWARRWRPDKEQKLTAEARRSRRFAEVFSYKETPRPPRLRGALEAFSLLLILLQDAQGVFAQDFADVVFGPAALSQQSGDRGQLRDVFEAVRHHWRAVEVAAEADVIGSGDFRDVLDVVDEDRQRHVRQLRLLVQLDLLRVVHRLALLQQRLRRAAELRVEIGAREIDAHRAAVAGDRFQHRIARVARVIGESARARRGEK